MGFGATHAVAVQIEAMGVVDEPVEDSLGIGRIADHLMPCRDWQLAGDDRRAAVITFFEDLEQIVPGLGVERLKTPVGAVKAKWLADRALLNGLYEQAQQPVPLF